MGGKGRRRSSPSRGSHSLSGRWGRAQTAPPVPRPPPASQALGSSGLRHCAGGSPAPKPLVPTPQHLQAPLILERHQELSQGDLGKFPGPLCQEVPGAPARPPTPRAVPGGAAPWSGEAGTVCSRSRDPSRSCVSQPPRPPWIMRHHPWLPGPTGL